MLPAAFSPPSLQILRYMRPGQRSLCTGRSGGQPTSAPVPHGPWPPAGPLWPPLPRRLDARVWQSGPKDLPCLQSWQHRSQRKLPAERTSWGGSKMKAPPRGTLRLFHSIIPLATVWLAGWLDHRYSILRNRDWNPPTRGVPMYVNVPVIKWTPFPVNTCERIIL